MKDNKKDYQGIKMKVTGKIAPMDVLSSREKIARYVAIESLKSAETALVAEMDILGTACPMTLQLSLAKIELVIRDLGGAA